MNDEPASHQTSRLGVILVAVAIVGSALGVAAWHLLSNRGGSGLDTSGFDMSAAPGSSRPAAPASSVAAAPEAHSGLGMVKGDAGMRVLGPGASTPSTADSSGGGAVTAKEKAALSFREAAMKNEKLIDAFIRRMQAKYPSIGQYGKDWVSHPDLRALRDQYWRDHNPLKFAYGMAKSDSFGKMLKKYATDPGILAVVTEGVRQAPPDLLAALGQVAQNDRVAKDLMGTVSKAMGLPASLTAFLDGSSTKPLDQNQVMSDIMKSPDIQKALQNQPPPVSEPAQDQGQPSGFTPLGQRR